MSERGSQDLYTAAIQQFRETSKWIVAAAAGMAALALGGSPLTGLGSLRPGARLWLAIIAGAVGLLGVAIVVWLAVRVLSGATLIISDVVSKPKYEKHRKEIFRRIGRMFPKVGEPEIIPKVGEPEINRWNILNDAFLSRCDRQLRSTSQSEQTEGKDGLYLVNLVLLNVALIETQNKFDTLCRTLTVVFPILVLSIGTFAWAANPGKDLAKAFDIPVEQGLALNDSDKTLLGKAGIAPTCLTRPARTLILRERAARMADGILLTDGCRPLRVTLSRDGHILDTGSRD
jgi:hypothetical protein